MQKGAGGFDFGKMLKQAQQIQEEMAKIQSELKEMIVEGTSGGGMVKVFMNGKQEMVSIKIEEDVWKENDKEMLEDLITAAVNQALENSKKLAEKEMSRLTGGLSIPGLF